MGYWSGEGLYGVSAVDIVSWSVFTVISLVLLWYVVRNTFPVMIVRDSLNKQKRELHERYRHLKASSEHLHYQLYHAKQDNKQADVAGYERQIQEIDEECRQIASIIGRKRKTLRSE